MTLIDFYILQDDTTDQRLLLACRLIEKAHNRQQQAFIHTANAEMSEQIDNLLWSFQDNSFLPHKICLANASAEHPETVLIGHDYEPDGSRPILINLAESVPYFFGRFKRTLEIVNQQEQVRAAGRQRYGFYQQHSYPLNHFNLEKKIS